MSAISIEINEDESLFILSGAVTELLSNRRAKLYLHDFLNSNISEGNDKISIRYEKGQKGDKEETLKKVRKMLKKFNFNEERSEEVEKSLSDFFQEEKKFELFSAKANEIRNNNVNPEEFERFVNSLNRHLPNRTLYELQLLSAYHMAFSQNACNFSVPGAGKTSIVYGAYSYLKNLPHNDPKKVDRLLIIGPLSSFGPWESEYRECFGVKARSVRLSGGMNKEDKILNLYSANPAEITLLSYQGVYSIKNDLIQFLKNNKVMVVLDEAHKIKNTDGGIIAESVLELSKYCGSRIILTGTPAPNGYADLLNLFKFIWPSKKVINFKKYHLEEMSKSPDDERVARLISDIEPYYIRIKKSDLGIPPAINNPPLIVPMGDEQKKIYDFIENKYMDYMMGNNDDAGLKSYLVKARLIRLMQAATNPSLLIKPVDDYMSENQFGNENFIDDSEIINSIMKYRKEETPSKFKVSLELIKEKLNKGEKVIVWMSYIQNMKDLSNYLEVNGVANKLLYGAVPVENGNDSDDEEETREKIIRDFHNSSSEFKVIIANPFATSESISLHKVCHNAIYIERSFNAAQFIQSKDRIHRYGLRKEDEINYYFILSENTIDETIHERLGEKERRMTELIENSDIPLFKMLDEEFDEDDIKVLIRNYVKKVSQV